MFGRFGQARIGPQSELQMISLSIFQPFRRWSESADRELQRKRSFEELKEEVRMMLRERRG